MGEVCQDHVTMLMTSEQQQAVKTMFLENNWACFMRVLSADVVANLRDNGFSIFLWQDEVEKIDDTNTHVDVKMDSGDITAAKEPSSGSVEAVSTAEKLVDSADTIYASKVSVERNNASQNAVAKNIGDQAANSEDLHTADSDVSEREHIDIDETSVSQETAKADKPLSEDLQGSRHAMSTRSRSQRMEARSDFVSNFVENSIPLEDNATLSDIKQSADNQTDIDLPRYNGTQRRKRRTKAKPGADLKCRYCKKVFDSSEELDKHLQLENEKRKKKKKAKQDEEEKMKEEGCLRCLECGKYLVNKRKLQMHMYATHKHLLPAFQCGICDATFKARKELYAHKKEANHNDKVSMLGSYQCDDCGKFMKRYDNFKKHKQFACPIIDEEALEKMKSHPCDQCGMTFKSPHHARRHKAVVHTDEPVVCDICGTVCKNQYRLTKHKTRHDENKRRHECTECGKKFFLKYVLMQHMRTHTKEKPYKCLLCDYKCAIVINLRKHVLTRHKIKATAEDLKKPKAEWLALGEKQQREGMLDIEKHLGKKGSCRKSKQQGQVQQGQGHQEQNQQSQGHLAQGHPSQGHMGGSLNVTMAGTKSTAIDLSNNTTSFIPYSSHSVVQPYPVNLVSVLTASKQDHDGQEMSNTGLDMRTSEQYTHLQPYQMEYQY